MVTGLHEEVGITQSLNTIDKEFKRTISRSRGSSIGMCFDTVPTPVHELDVCTVGVVLADHITRAIGASRGNRVIDHGRHLTTPKRVYPDRRETASRVHIIEMLRATVRTVLKVDRVIIETHPYI